MYMVTAGLAGAARKALFAALQEEGDLGPITGIGQCEWFIERSRWVRGVRLYWLHRHRSSSKQGAGRTRASPTSRYLCRRPRSRRRTLYRLMFYPVSIGRPPTRAQALGRNISAVPGGSYAISCLLRCTPRDRSRFRSVRSARAFPGLSSRDLGARSDRGCATDGTLW